LQRAVVRRIHVIFVGQRVLIFDWRMLVCVVNSEIFRYEDISKIFRTDAVKIIKKQINVCENWPRPPSYVQLGTLTH
jgi:hypothetical protein